MSAPRFVYRETDPATGRVVRTEALTDTEAAARNWPEWSRGRPCRWGRRAFAPLTGDADKTTP